MCQKNAKKLLEDIRILQVNFIIIYIIHKILVLLKNTRILINIKDFSFFQKVISFCRNI